MKRPNRCGIWRAATLDSRGARSGPRDATQRWRSWPALTTVLSCDPHPLLLVDSGTTQDPRISRPVGRSVSGTPPKLRSTDSPGGPASIVIGDVLVHPAVGSSGGGRGGGRTARGARRAVALAAAAAVDVRVLASIEGAPTAAELGIAARGVRTYRSSTLTSANVRSSASGTQVSGSADAFPRNEQPPGPPQAVGPAVIVGHRRHGRMHRARRLPWPRSERRDRAAAVHRRVRLHRRAQHRRRSRSSCVGA
jgi:hypothetical protein